MGGGGGGGNKNRDDETDETNAVLMNMMRPAFMGNQQAMLARQLSKGGYGTEQGIPDHLGAIHTPMQQAYVQPEGFGPVHSGAAYMNALRKQLDAAGVNTNVSEMYGKDSKNNRRGRD